MRAANPVATGRYLEDVYFGGTVRAFTNRVFLPSTFHPILIIIIFNCLSGGTGSTEFSQWYLATLAIAEQLYEVLLTWDTLRVIDVTLISQAFFAHHPRDVSRRLRLDHDQDGVAPLRGDPAYADGFLAIIAHSYRRRARRAVRQSERRPSERCQSIVELRDGANGFLCGEGWVRWCLGCKEFGSRLLSRQAIGVRMITFVASLCVPMDPNKLRFPQRCEAPGLGFRITPTGC